MMQVISTTSHRRSVRSAAALGLAGFAAVFALIAATAAQAGECPADKRVADGRGQPMASHGPQGVTDTVIAFTELSKEPVKIDGRQFRARKLEIAAGGIVPWHSHGDRPAMILITQGEITEYASTCAVPIVHKAGEVTAERSPTSHWWKNTGSQPVVIWSFDLFRSEDKVNAKMM